MEKIQPQFIFNNLFLESRAVFEIMLKNIVEQDRPQMIIRRMLFVCWITKNTYNQTQSILYLLFFKARRLTPTHLLLLLYVHCLFCLVVYFVRIQLITGL